MKIKMKRLLLITSVVFCLTNPKIALADSADIIYTNAYNSVQKCLNERSQSSVNNARQAINKMKGTEASWAIGEFSKQVDGIQHPILKDIVINIDKTKKVYDIYEVEKNKAVIAELPVAEWRNSYSSALDQQTNAIIGEVAKNLENFKRTRQCEDLYRTLDALAELGGSENKDIKNFIENVKNESIGVKVVTENELLSTVSPKVLDALSSIEMNSGKYIPKSEMRVSDLRNIKKASINLPTFPEANYYYEDKLYYLALLNNIEVAKIYGKTDYGVSMFAAMNNLKELVFYNFTDSYRIKGIELCDYSNIEKVEIEKFSDCQLKVFKDSKNLKSFYINSNTAGVADKNMIDFSKFQYLEYINIRTNEPITSTEFLLGCNKLSQVHIRNSYDKNTKSEEIQRIFKPLNNLSNLKELRVSHDLSVELFDVIVKTLPNIKVYK